MFQKSFLFSLSLALMLGLLSCNSTTKDGYVVKGEVAGLSSPNVYLVNPLLQKITDTATVNNGKFEFTGKLTEPDLYLVFTPEQQRLGVLYLENGEFSLKGDLKDPKSFKVTGGKQQTVFNQLQEELDALTAKFEPVMKNMQGSDPALLDSLNKAQQVEFSAIAKKYIAANASEPVGAFIAQQFMQQGHDFKEMEETFKLLSPENQKSKYGTMLSDAIGEAKKFLGEPALDFTQNDVNGKPVSLASFKGKYVLVDFWASWCKPCRAENPAVVAAYNQYKAKNFTILGVSLDSDKQAWLDAIQKDGLTWTQVSDLQQWKNAAAQLYGIQSIPFNLLLDPEGKVIAKNLRGAELQKKLAEIFKS